MAVFRPWDRIATALILLFLLIASTLAHGESLDVSVSDHLAITPAHVTYLTGDDYDIEQVSALPEKAWNPINKSSVSVPVRAEAVWFRFQLSNSAATALERVLEVRWINLRNIDFWQVNSSNAIVAHTRAGLDVPFEDIVEHNSSWIERFAIPAGEQRTVYVRIYSEFTTFMPAFVWSPEAFRDHQQTRFYWYCLAFGALIALAIYNLSLSAFTRDRSYLYYSIYALAAVGYEAGTTGIGHYAIWADWGWLRGNMFFIAIYMAFLMSGIFIRRFLKLYERRDWVRYTADGLILFWGAGFAFHLLSGGIVVGGMIEIAALVSCAIALIVSVYLSGEGDVSARYFTVAWSGLLVLTFFTVLMLQGLAPYNFMSENGQIMGFVVEMLLLSFALAERINRERSSREYAQKLALTLEQEAREERDAKLKMQNDLLTMQREINQQLEQRVAERTDALEQARRKLEAANIELSALTLTDPLTQVANRRHFDNTIELECSRSGDSGKTFALLLTDIDHFKQFNDVHGHLTGDDCLRVVASALQSAIPGQAGLVARYGGEEFAILLENRTISDALISAEKIRNAVEQLCFVAHGQRIPVRISVGVAGYLPGDTPDAVIARADKALYQAKTDGRNCVREAV